MDITIHATKARAEVQHAESIVWIDLLDAGQEVTIFLDPECGHALGHALIKACRQVTVRNTAIAAARIGEE